MRITGLGDEDFPHQHDRAQWPEMKARVADVFKTKTRDEWVELMEGTDVCFAPVLSPQEAYIHPHKRRSRHLRRGRRGDATGAGAPLQPHPWRDLGAAAAPGSAHRRRPRRLGLLRRRADAAPRVRRDLVAQSQLRARRALGLLCGWFVAQSQLRAGRALGLLCGWFVAQSQLRARRALGLLCGWFVAQSQLRAGRALGLLCGWFVAQSQLRARRALCGFPVARRQTLSDGNAGLASTPIPTTRPSRRAARCCSRRGPAIGSFSSWPRRVSRVNRPRVFSRTTRPSASAGSSKPGSPPASSASIASSSSATRTRG